MPLSSIAVGSEVVDARHAEAERRLLDRQMAETLTLLETLIAAAPFGFAFVDRDFRFVRINENLAAINGATVAEHVGRLVADVVPEIWPQLEPLYRRVLDGDTTTVDVAVDARGEVQQLEPGRRGAVRLHRGRDHRAADLRVDTARSRAP